MVRVDVADEPGFTDIDTLSADTEKSETVSGIALLSFAMKLESPRYEALIECVPAGTALEVRIAVPFASIAWPSKLLPS